MDYEEDWFGFYEGPGARPVFGMGKDFVAVNGERSFFLFMIARWACIPLSWIGAITCFLWARDLFGRPAGVMACALWCFSPNILAHASLITADVGGTALGISCLLHVLAVAQTADLDPGGSHRRRAGTC